MRRENYEPYKHLSDDTLRAVVRDLSAKLVVLHERNAQARSIALLDEIHWLALMQSAASVALEARLAYSLHT